MKKIKPILFAILLASTIMACEKEGPIGPAGDRGEQGTTGAKGDKGENGERGAAGPKGATGAKGSTGATGPKGATGDKGAQGPAGKDGNANVILYEFGEYTFTNTLNLNLSVSKETVDNSLLLIYYNPAPEDATAWYAVPGLGASAFYQTRYFIYQFVDNPSIYNLTIKTLKSDGSLAYGLPVTFNKIKVIFAKASSIVTGKMDKQINLQDYNAVKTYYGLKN